ncbi:hypothetical protein CJA_3533 [Cellvibrio japonicus Ueda107]|uniref:Uncharacterized protein n=1 Tax=Cellvibrio japonicus (strain Ueda107) TaxID=498211 RepID=B3PG79_CELJU|nr:hypothetical protein CJA_3533 [Cellvibrio japonicus Ueda107]
MVRIFSEMINIGAFCGVAFHAGKAGRVMAKFNLSTCLKRGRKPCDHAIAIVYEGWLAWAAKEG